MCINNLTRLFFSDEGTKQAIVMFFWSFRELQISIPPFRNYYLELFFVVVFFLLLSLWGRLWYFSIALLDIKNMLFWFLNSAVLLLNAQSRPHVLVHNIADAHGRDDLHEVGQDASIESKKALFFQDLLHHQVHRQLL